jgi:hypothetical protein
MRKQTIKILVLVALFALLGPVVALAQSWQWMTVRVPFDFHVGEKVFPAGKYRVQASTGQSTVLIQSADYRSAKFALTNGCQNKRYADRPELIFKRYGGKHFLSRVWLAYSNAGRELPVTRTEREAALMAARHEDTAVVGSLEITAP